MSLRYNDDHFYIRNCPRTDKWTALREHNIQCESKNPPLRFSDNFFQTDGNFLINFYTPIIRSFLHQTTNFYSILSKFDEVMPY